MAHAAFGLLNSTLHSIRAPGSDQSRAALRAMTVAALSVTAPRRAPHRHCAESR